MYRLADLGMVWIDAQIYEEDLASIVPGQPASVRLTYAGGPILTSTVSQILPQVNETTRTANRAACGGQSRAPASPGHVRRGPFQDRTDTERNSRA